MFLVFPNFCPAHSITYPSLNLSRRSSRIFPKTLQSLHSFTVKARLLDSAMLSSRLTRAVSSSHSNRKPGLHFSRSYLKALQFLDLPSVSELQNPRYFLDMQPPSQQSLRARRSVVKSLGSTWVSIQHPSQWRASAKEISNFLRNHKLSRSSDGRAAATNNRKF